MDGHGDRPYIRNLLSLILALHLDAWLRTRKGSVNHCVRICFLALTVGIEWLPSSADTRQRRKTLALAQSSLHKAPSTRLCTPLFNCRCRCSLLACSIPCRASKDGLLPDTPSYRATLSKESRYSEAMCIVTQARIQVWHGLDRSSFVPLGREVRGVYYCT